MLVSSNLQPVAKDIYVGEEKEMYKFLFLKNLSAINPSEFEGQRIVVKGCGDKEVESYAYAEITKILRPVTRSIMYGEPCSTVPVYKSKA
jgi:hypothetical protein